MAFLLFVDESGQDGGASPYEVLAGIAIEDQDVWNLILALHDAEVRQFGMRYTTGSAELKARKLLKRKTFRLAGLADPIPLAERAQLARECLEQGAGVTNRNLAALAQSKLEFVREAFEIASRFRCKAFASIVNPASPAVDPGEHLRKDYAYLFERFFYFLEDANLGAMGLVVFDEVEASKSIQLSEQMHRYFLRTENGRLRASHIVPEPMFVRSELSSGVQLADLLAYIVSWSFRLPMMHEPVRPELSSFVDQVCAIRHRATREIAGNPEFVVWSFCWIDDLRTQEDRE